MMNTALFSIFIVVALLAGGYLFGKLSPKKVNIFLINQISKVVLLLLFLIGVEFGDIFSQKAIGIKITKNAFILSSLISLLTIIILYRKTQVSSHNIGLKHFFFAIKGSVIAIGFFLLGVIVYYFYEIDIAKYGLKSDYVLYLLIFFVGIDLVNFKLEHIDKNLILVPVLIVLASIIAAAIFSLYSTYTFYETLVLISGFGWFSLSGPIVNHLVSTEMGSMAFLTDFFREIFSILFLFFWGQKQPLAGIGLSGAAALDSALPFIKQNCQSKYIPYALVSGFLLTLFAPVFITLSVQLLP
ncbi:lysine exporter LysO family protein [Avibacterium avium]|uniref:lysine exporter LysO family protein n=1 Tax=Avibacterium avium TaxID=751 RepID=UPI003BF9147D